MNQPELDKFIDELKVSSDFLQLGAFAGNSQCLRRFCEEVEKTSATASKVILVDRPFQIEILDRSIVESLAPNNPRKLMLHSGSDCFNSQKLFGAEAPNIFESGESLIIIGLENIDKSIAERFCRYWLAWHTNERNLIILGKPSVALTCVKTELASLAPIILHLPRLKDRENDILFCIQHVASRHAGGLDNFSIEAINVLTGLDLNEDQNDLEYLIEYLYRKRDLSNAVFSADHVEQAIKQLPLRRNAHLLSLARHDVVELWQSVKRKLTEIDSRSTSLTSQPFFSSNSVNDHVVPLSSHAPELQFLQLISWAYKTLFERSAVNLKAIAKHFNAYHLDEKTFKKSISLFGNLRTYCQHSLEYLSPHDQNTLESTHSWFQDAIGRRHPEEEDFERCSKVILMQVDTILETTLTFLKHLQDDEFGEAILSQWKHFRETKWPKHRFVEITAAVIASQERNDLKPEVVADQLLGKLQKRLSATNSDDDQERVVIGLIEKALCDQYKRPMPITGRDVIALGVEPGELVSQVVCELQRRFEKDNLSREQLLVIAAELCGKK